MCNNTQALAQTQNEKAALFVLAFLLAGAEKFIPAIPVLPWLKIGLFHAVVMVWIFRYGFLDALAFVFVRQWVVMCFFGFSFLPLTLGASATLVSVSAAALLLKSRLFGTAAIAIFCAALHNITQLFVLYLITGGNFAWLWQVPIMLFVSLFTGTATGVLAVKINALSFDFGEFSGEKFAQNAESSANIAPKANIWAIFALAGVIVSTFVFENYIFYTALFAGILLTSKIAKCKMLSPFAFAKRYGIFIVALYVFSSPFTHGAALSAAKITLWFLLAPLFQKSGFYAAFYGVLRLIFGRKYSQTLSIGAIMPQVFASVLEALPSAIKAIFRSPHKISAILSRKTAEIIREWQDEGERFSCRK